MWRECSTGNLRSSRCNAADPRALILDEVHLDRSLRVFEATFSFHARNVHDSYERQPILDSVTCSLVQYYDRELPVGQLGFLAEGIQVEGGKCSNTTVPESGKSVQH